VSKPGGLSRNGIHNALYLPVKNANYICIVINMRFIWYTSFKIRLLDPPLSDLGNVQAQELAAELSRANSLSDRPITRVVTSPFLRCVETANPIAGESITINISVA